jgi:hypothetical protein
MMFRIIEIRGRMEVEEWKKEALPLNKSPSRYYEFLMVNIEHIF